VIGRILVEHLHEQSKTMADAVSIIGYIFLGGGGCALVLTYGRLAAQRKLPICGQGPAPAVSSSPSQVQVEADVEGRRHETQQQSVVACAKINVFAAALVALGNIMVYRVVLAEQLLGVVLTWGHGPVALITTVLILCSLLHLLAENLIMLGRGTLPRSPTAFAARGFASVLIIFLILFGKLAMGIVYYADPLVLWRCQAPPPINSSSSGLHVAR
jgi:hypothetical protein